MIHVFLCICREKNYFPAHCGAWSHIWPLMTFCDLWRQNQLSDANQVCNISIITENYIAGWFGYVAAYSCYTFGPPKSAPGDIHIYHETPKVRPYFLNYLHGNKTLNRYSLILRSNFVDPSPRYIWWMDGYCNHLHKNVELSKVFFF